MKPEVDYSGVSEQTRTIEKNPLTMNIKIHDTGPGMSALQKVRFLADMTEAMNYIFMLWSECTVNACAAVKRVKNRNSISVGWRLSSVSNCMQFGELRDFYRHWKYLWVSNSCHINGNG